MHMWSSVPVRPERMIQAAPQAVTALAFVTVIALSAGDVVAQQGSPKMLDPNLSVRAVVNGLVTPTSLAFLGTNDFFILEKNTGKVKRVVNGAVQSTVLDLAVNNSEERGLLGIALDPNFAANKYAYLYWTCAAPHPTNPSFASLERCPAAPAYGQDIDDILAVPLLGNRVDRFIWNGTNLTFDRNLIMLHAFQNDGAPVPPNQGDEGQPPAGSHNGGVLRFGSDGKLYIVIGDNGRRGQLQNLHSGPTPTGLGVPVPDDQYGGPFEDNAHFTGVIVRLNPDGTTPSDNPFFGVGAAIGGEPGANIQKMFAYGIRNSFGMAVDPATGRLWLSENGDDAFDEIHAVPAGLNSGWIQIMGPSSRLAEYRLIENSSRYFGLAQERWPPTNIAATTAEALARLFMLPGAVFKDPEFSWKFALAPAAIGFAGSELGMEFAGDMFVGFAEAEPLGGPLFRLKLNSGRTAFAFSDPRLADGVADNLEKHDLRESENLLIGTNFGIITDIQKAPGGSLFAVSLDKGTVYEIFREAATGCATDVTNQARVTPSGYRFNASTQRFSQTLQIRNSGVSPITGPISLAVSGLSSGISLFNAYGTTSCSAPAGRAYVRVFAGDNNTLLPGETAKVDLEFTNPSLKPITYTPQVLAGKANR